MNGNLRICTLFSGSSGNSVFFSSGNTHILFDAGKSAKAVTASLSEIGVDMSDISAVFVTHEHTDHIAALEVISKKYHIPIHMARECADSIVGKECMCSCIVPHETEFSVTVGDVTVESFRTYHDSAVSVGYTAKADGASEKFGLMTDTGHYTAEIVDILSDCTHLVIEANHDRDMVKESFYPYHVKRRILSDSGHLSNEQCGELLAVLSEGRVREILLAHLSENNNTPERALKAVANALDLTESGLLYKVAERNKVTRLL